MKKRFVIAGVVAGVVAIAAAGIAYKLLKKPTNSEELATKAVLAMSDVKSFDVNGSIDAEASVGSQLSLPAGITFDGNYNLEENTGLINYTLKTSLLGQDLKYSDVIDLSDTNQDSTDADQDSSNIGSSLDASDSTAVAMESSVSLLENSEFKYNKKEHTYSIIINMEDVMKLEVVEEMLLGKESALHKIGITEEQLLAALNDDAEVELTFNSKYYLSEISIDSMDIEKDVDLMGLGNLSAKVSFETDIQLSNYQ